MPDSASISLNASVVASKGLSSNSVYSATKAAIRSFARTWTTDLKNRRIRVNAISPGTIDTPGFNDLLASGEAGEQRKKMISTAIPLGRLGKPDEIATTVVFLASDDASYITGTELFIDGGSRRSNFRTVGHRLTHPLAGHGSNFLRLRGRLPFGLHSLAVGVGRDLSPIPAQVHAAPDPRALLARVVKVKHTAIALSNARSRDSRQQVGKRIRERRECM